MTVIPPSHPRAPSHTTIEAQPEDFRANKLFRHMAREGGPGPGVADRDPALRQGRDDPAAPRPGRRDLPAAGGRAAGQPLCAVGREVGYRRILPGSYFGEISAIDGLPRSVNIVALEDARLARLPHRLVQRLFDESPRFMRALLEDMASLTRALTDRLFELTAVSVACRVDIELLRMASAAGGDGLEAVIHPCPTHAELAVGRQPARARHPRTEPPGRAQDHSPERPHHEVLDMEASWPTRSNASAASSRGAPRASGESRRPGRRPPRRRQR
jgi:CRP/FNR family cyclic AMP-dependent transcriptional regulator